MAIELCPRCKLNYVKPGMKYCKVCMRDFEDIESDGEVCPMCGENLLDEGEDLCAECLDKRMEMSKFTIEDDDIAEVTESDDEDDEMDGMRLVDLDDEETSEEVKEDFDTE